MGKAKYIRTLEGWTGVAALYHVDPPMSYWILGETQNKEQTNYVIISATSKYTPPETFIFPATEEGLPINYLELNGSYKGGLDHLAALEMAGYELEAADA